MCIRDRYFSSTTKNVTNISETITLQPGEYRLFSSEALENPLGVDDVISKNTAFQIFPNPSSKTIFINSPATKVELFDMSGKKVKSFLGAFNKNHAFDIQDLNTGIYFVKIETNNSTITKKLLKKAF